MAAPFLRSARSAPNAAYLGVRQEKGMPLALRNQPIEIGSTIRTIIGNVEGLRLNERCKMQTGFVRYDNAYCPVWRLYDPSDVSADAEWRKGVWRKIYEVVMTYDPNGAFVEPTLIEYSDGGITEMLPEVKLKIAKSLRRHILKNA